MMSCSDRSPIWRNFRRNVLVKRVVIDDTEAIEIKTRGQCIDSPCAAIPLYIDAHSYLPIRWGEEIARFEHERLDRSALPDDFFSADLVSSVAAKLPSPPAEWRAIGRTPYWLGPSFEGQVPEAGTPLDSGDDAVFGIGYAPARRDAFPRGACISLQHSSDLVPLPLPEPIESIATLTAPIGAADNLPRRGSLGRVAQPDQRGHACRGRECDPPRHNATLPRRHDSHRERAPRIRRAAPSGGILGAFGYAVAFIDIRTQLDRSQTDDAV